MHRYTITDFMSVSDNGKRGTNKKVMGCEVCIRQAVSPGQACYRVIVKVL